MLLQLTKSIQTRKQRGLTLIELFLALAVIAIIWVVATRYYQVVSNSSKVNEAVQMIQSLRSAGNHYAAGRSNYDGLTIAELNNTNLLPRDLEGSGTTPGEQVNPWGGNIGISGSGGQMQITLSDVPQADCQNIANKLSNQAAGSPTCNGGNLQANFDS